MNTRLHLESLDDRTLPSVTSSIGSMYEAFGAEAHRTAVEEPAIVVRYEVAALIANTEHPTEAHTPTTEGTPTEENKDGQIPEAHTPDEHADEKKQGEEDHPTEEGHEEKKDEEHPTEEGGGHESEGHKEEGHEGEHDAAAEAQHEFEHAAGELLIEMKKHADHEEHELHLAHEREHAHAHHEDHGHAAHGGHEEHAHDGGHGEGHGGHGGGHGDHHGGEHAHGGHESEDLLEGEHGDEHGEGGHDARVVHVGAEGHATGLTELSTEDVDHGDERHNERIAEMANHGREAIMAATDHVLFSHDIPDVKNVALAASATASPTMIDAEAAIALGAFESFPGTDLAAAATAGMLTDEKNRQLLMALLQDLGANGHPLPLDRNTPEPAERDVGAGNLAANTATPVDLNANNDVFATFHSVPDLGGTGE